MERIDFYFTPNNASYEQMQVYNYFKSLDLIPRLENKNVIILEPSPEYICEEAIYLLDNVPLDEINSQKILADLTSHLIPKPLPKSLPALPSLNLNQQRPASQEKCINTVMADYILLAIEMLILQKETLEYSEQDFLQNLKINIPKSDRNYPKFLQLPHWLADALNQNPRPQKYTNEYIWNLFNSEDDHICDELYILISSAQRGFNAKGHSVDMYYSSSIIAICEMIHNKYYIKDAHLLFDAFNESLWQNKQQINKSMSGVYESNIVEFKEGKLDENGYHSRLAQLYSKVITLYDDCIYRDSDMLDETARNFRFHPMFNYGLLCIDLITRIKSTYEEIKKKREFLGLPDLLANTSKPKQTKKETPAEISAFDQMVDYARNRFKNEEMQTIVKMLMHIYHSDEKKYAIIEQIEPEWNELHSPKTTVNVENGASYNEIHDNEKVDLSK